MKSTNDILNNPIRTNIEYEWETLRGCMEKRYIRGLYSSLDRLCRLYTEERKLKQNHDSRMAL